MNWRGRTIYLVGLPGAGKSTIGRELAKLLPGYEFVDLDELIESQQGKTIPEIISQYGEETFREIETRALSELAQSNKSDHPVIVATGGGIILRDQNRRIMRGSGLVIWIDITVRDAAKRILAGALQGQMRPLLYSQSEEELLERLKQLARERQPYYEQATLHFVAKSQGEAHTAVELAEELLKALQEMSRQVKLKPRFKVISAHSSRGNYAIAVGSGIAVNELTHLIQEHSAQDVVIITDQNVGKLYGTKVISKLRQSLTDGTRLHRIDIEPGEQSKSQETLTELLQYLSQHQVSRRGSVIVALGGGVVTDLAGFAASIFKRGVPIVHIPTTLLAQVDAAIGGKTGINFGGSKNSIGTFYQPKAILIDPLFLRTLPERDLHAGLAEVFKYGLIGSNAFWKELSKNVRRIVRGIDTSYEQLIYTSVKEKLRYVEEDEFELQSGKRELLNFGHTFGHALESVTQYEVFLHGEAVLLGMRAAAWLSHELGLLSEQEWKEIEVTLGRVPVTVSTNLSSEEIYEKMLVDKKSMKGSLRLVLLDKIGSARIVENAPKDTVLQAIDFMLSLF